ncbi:MAG: hypothetical protein ACOCXA_02450 [Planctomycetota bacterium]
MDRTSTSVYYTWIFFILLLGVLAWLLVPLFSPVWLWWHVDRDPQAFARAMDVPVEQITKEYVGTVVYRPRAEGDPIPWQLVDSQPMYETDKIQEWDVLVRAHLISGGDGEPPGLLMLGSTTKARFYKLRFRRFPPGSFGFESPRPVLVYDPMSMEVQPIGIGKSMESMLKEYDEDHWIWPERDDAWQPPPPEAETGP